VTIPPITRSPIRNHATYTNRNCGHINGRLAIEPVNGTQYKMGQRMQIGRSDVEDWMVNQGDAIYGGYSARVAMAQLPENERAKYEKMFRD
jgi:uncharacterized protein YegJ (DUF2314 family)